MRGGTMGWRVLVESCGRVGGERMMGVGNTCGAPLTRRRRCERV